MFANDHPMTAGIGDSGDEYHQLDGSQHLLLDVMTTQMPCLLNRNNEELYRQIEGLEHQMLGDLMVATEGSMMDRTE